MAIRHWHWLLTQKKDEPEPTDYKVRGTAINNAQFEPDYAGYEQVPLMDNNYYNYYLNGDIDPEITPLNDKVYYYYDYQDYTQKYFYIENNTVVDYTPPKPNGSITFNVKFKTDGVVDSDFTNIVCSVSPEGDWEFTYSTNKVIYSIDSFHNENDTYYDEIYGEFSDYATHILTSVDFSKCDRLNSLVSMTNAFSGCVYLRNIVFSNKQSFTNLEYATRCVNVSGRWKAFRITP